MKHAQHACVLMPDVPGRAAAAGVLASMRIGKECERGWRCWNVIMMMSLLCENYDACNSWSSWPGMFIFISLCFLNPNVLLVLSLFVYSILKM